MHLCLCSPQKIYRSDLNYLRGAAWIATGALQIEGSKKASDLISDVRISFRLSVLFMSACAACEGLGGSSQYSAGDHKQLRLAEVLGFHRD